VKHDPPSAQPWAGKPGQLALTPAIIRMLGDAGLLLDGLAKCHRLSPLSQIEGPTAIQSRVPTGARLVIGAFCNLSGGSVNHLLAGRYCSVATGVTIGAHEHPTDWVTTSRIAYFPQVNGWDRLTLGEDAADLPLRTPLFRTPCPVTTLGHDVWIGQGAWLKAGVTVGTGAIIGARATVVKDVPPYAIVVGTPARVVRLRFPDAVIERLLASAWWRFALLDMFDAPFDQIEKALDIIEQKVSSGQVQPFVAPVFTVGDLAQPQQVLAQLQAMAQGRAR
jgi:acetyltransferase-like isoleucine patch superfamily enzyme